MKTKEKVYEILKALSCKDKIGDRDRLREDLMLDSLAMVILLIETEDKLGIRFDEADMNPFDLDTVQNVIDMVARYCGDENE